MIPSPGTYMDIWYYWLFHSLHVASWPHIFLAFFPPQWLLLFQLLWFLLLPLLLFLLLLLPLPPPSILLFLFLSLLVCCFYYWIVNLGNFMQSKQAFYHRAWLLFLSLSLLILRQGLAKFPEWPWSHFGSQASFEHLILLSQPPN